jgi:hypothetical protein
VFAHRLSGAALPPLPFCFLPRPLVFALAGVLCGGQGCGGSKSSAPKTDAGNDATSYASADGGSGGGPEGSADDAAADAPAEAQAVKTWDWTGIIGTGQSLSVGAQGSPIASTTQPYHNLKLSLGSATVPPFDPMNSALTLVPLVEPIRGFAQFYPSAYPSNIDGETPHSAMANQITALFQQGGGDDYVTVHTVVGESGQPMSVIDKTATEVVDAGMSMGRAYAATLFEAQAIARLAATAHKTYGIGAIVITHGESDADSSTYESDLVKLWTDYNHDLLPITGQSASIPMLVSQQHSVPMDINSTSTSTLAEWHVGVAHPNDIVCSGPKYQYPYFTDHIHLTTPGYDRLGEKYAEVYFEKAVLGHSWKPLQPNMVERSGSVVTVHFDVPNPPLVWDDSLPSPHQTALTQWANGRGFEVSSVSGPVAISSVAIVNDTVQITCAVDVSSLYISVAYAFTADGTQMTGGTSRWGQLRDSDPFVGHMTKAAQPNYCVAFSMHVP